VVLFGGQPSNCNQSRYLAWKIPILANGSQYLQHVGFHHGWESMLEIDHPKSIFILSNHFFCFHEHLLESKNI
jgi:hypothetical protein